VLLLFVIVFVYFEISYYFSLLHTS